jgi:hypothetical protein
MNFWVMFLLFRCWRIFLILLKPMWGHLYHCMPMWWVLLQFILSPSFFQGVVLGWWKIAYLEKSLMHYVYTYTYTYKYTYTYSSNQLHLIYHFWFNFLFQGRNADSLSQYFGEDPSRCPFEQGLLFSPWLSRAWVCFNSYLVLRIIYKDPCF